MRNVHVAPQVGDPVLVSFPRILLRTTLLLCFILFSAHADCGATQPANSRDPFPFSVGLSARFAVADFDGDRRPDVASVQVGQRGEAGKVSYSIELRLSASDWKSIQVVGPPGGLLIRAADVNNDSFIDLTFVAAWSQQPVAILLNDGSGNFAPAPTLAFPDAFASSRGPSADESSGIVRAPDVTLSQERTAMYPAAEKMSGTRLAIRSFRPCRVVIISNSFFNSRPPRAPPFELCFT